MASPSSLLLAAAVVRLSPANAQVLAINGYSLSGNRAGNGASNGMVGGIPPVAVTTAACNIMDVFTDLQNIQSSPDCRAGCGGGGGCPPSWVPGGHDTCSPACGRTFEPFWDECGAMLLSMHMGGMDEMGLFYDACLIELYPPGSCGTFCNAHTYQCYLSEIQAACCNENGLDWSNLKPALFSVKSIISTLKSFMYSTKPVVFGVFLGTEFGSVSIRSDPASDVPLTCPVGCALVFPEFVEVCRDHIAGQGQAVAGELRDFEAFESDCLDADGEK